MRCLHFILIPLIAVVLGVGYDKFTSHKIPSTYKSYQDTISTLSTTPYLTAMTFNTRWSDLNNKEDRGPKSWHVRRTRVADIIKTYAPAFVGTQENLMLQNDDLQQLLGPTYESVGWCQVSIFYHKQKLALLESGEFSLNKTFNPNRRRATWAKFRTLQPVPEKEILVVNTHNDPFLESRRRVNVAIIWDQITQLSNNGSIPVFLTGDFNSCPGHVPHSFLTGKHVDGGRMVDAWEECVEVGPEKCVRNEMIPSYHHFQGAVVNGFLWRIVQYFIFTIHGVFNTPQWDRMHIDWILFKNPRNDTAFISPRFMSVVVEESDYVGQIASDHFPVVGVFAIKK